MAAAAQGDGGALFPRGPLVPPGISTCPKGQGPSGWHLLQELHLCLGGGHDSVLMRLPCHLRRALISSPSLGPIPCFGPGFHWVIEFSILVPNCGGRLTLQRVTLGLITTRRGTLQCCEETEASTQGSVDPAVPDKQRSPQQRSHTLVMSPIPDSMSPPAVTLRPYSRILMLCLSLPGFWVLCTPECSAPPRDHSSR